MSEFKYACPVCGQHIKCDSSQTGTVMECPTCFQKITVPQAPATGDQKLIITGTKVGERPAPNIPEYRAAAAEKRSPLAAVAVLLILACAAGAAVYLFRGTIFKTANAPVTPDHSQPAARSNAASQPELDGAAPTNPPVPTGTNYWTLNVNAVGTPDVPAGGKVHGRYFTAERMILNKDGLTIRTASFPPEAGITIYLRPDPIESLFGKLLVFNASTPGAPPVYLRWKNEQGKEIDQPERSYALRLEFGQPANDHISGKIYLCTPDEMKSYVVGNFNAEIVKTKLPQEH